MLADLHNLRDVGGLRTTAGGSVRTEVLYRCGTPAFLDDAQARALVEDLGIRTRVDLRGDREAAEETSAALLARERRVVHTEVHAGGVRWDFESSSRAEWVGQHYLAFARESADVLVGFARLLSEPGEQPVLVHCTAGKDRTGTAVAVVLSAVGVGDEEVVADYGRTNAAMPALVEQFGRLPAYQQRLRDVPAEAFGAPPEAMRLFLQLLRAEYGDARGYLAAHGMSEPELAALTAALVAD